MLFLRLSKREDQALIPISTILKFSALGRYPVSETKHGVFVSAKILTIRKLELYLYFYSKLVV